MIDAMNLAILIGAGLIAISVFTSLLSLRFGAPLLLIFLAIGVLAGENGVGGIDFDNAAVAYFIGTIALAVILFDSGFETRLHGLRIAAGPALTLATAGVLVTAGLTGLAARPIFDLPWDEALLLGAIVSSTDAAAVFLLLRVGGITVRDRVRSTLEIESGSNDPIAILLTVSLVEIVAGGAGGERPVLGVLRTFAVDGSIGIALGIAGGFAIVQAVNRIRLDAGLYPVLVLALALLVYAAAATLHGSGFIAVYIAGMIAGNARLPIQGRLRRFQSGMTWLAQIGMFLTLGLLATPSQFPGVMLPAILLALVLIFVARPVAVWLCLLPFGFGRREMTFVGWVGLRGAVSILLGILPLIAGLPGAQTIFNVSFLVVVVSLLIQGWTVRPMAKWLRLIVPPRIGPVDRVELELPDRASHELVVYRVHPQSPVARGERIPRWARPALVVREGQSLDIHRAGRPRAGDQIYIFTNARQVPLLDRLFASRAALPPDDQDFYGDFSLHPDATLQDVAATYGVTVPAGIAMRSVADHLYDAFGGRVEVGDRLPLGGLELIVRNLDDHDRVTEVGLAVAPERLGSRGLPLFQSRAELADLAARLLARWRARRTGGKADAPAATVHGTPPTAAAMAEAAPDAPAASHDPHRPGL
jgi:cell volume regulation protein A